MREALLDFVANRLIGFANQRSEFLGKVIFRTGIADKVQHGAALFIVCQSQATP